jgi:hypothetical protein
VEQICSHRTWGRHKVLQYLIKWKGYPESDNTWENANQIHTPILIKLYHQNAAQRTIKVRRIHLKQHQFPGSIPFRHSIARLCSLTTNPFFIATTAHSLPLDPIGFATTSLSADTTDSITALSAQEHSELEPTSKRTSLTSTRSTPQLDVESTKSNPSTHPTKTPFYYPIRHSYIDSNRWRRPFTPFVAPLNPNHACARPRCPASTLSQESPSDSSSSDFLTRFRRSTPMNTNASASSTIAHSIIKRHSPKQTYWMSADVHHRAEGDVTSLGAVS